LAMERRGGRPSPSFLFLSSVRPWERERGGQLGRGHGGRGAAAKS
jgi:hypothetical protein